MARASCAKFLEFCTQNIAKIGLGKVVPLGRGTPCHLTLAALAAWHWHPMPHFCSVFLPYFLPQFFVLVEPTFLHSYPGLSSKLFWVNVSNFWDALHELSAICAIFFYYPRNQQKTNK